MQLFILVTYILVLYGISWYASKLIRQGKGGAVQYLLAGRNLPTVVVAAMLAGLAIGGASTVGVAEHAYKVGLSAGWYNAAWGTAGIIVGLFVADYFRRMEVNTIPEMMERMYGKQARMISVLAQLLIMMVITSLQYVAGGAVLTALMPSVFTFQTGMLVTAVLFVGITFIGGYWGAGLTNVVNVVVIYGGILAALRSSSEVFGGMESIAASLPAGGPWFDFFSGTGLAMITSWMVVMITQGFSVQAISQIAFAAKDGRAARHGYILGGLVILPAGFLCALFGIIAAAKFPNLEKAALALPTIMTNISPVVGGIFLAALWAAGISTAVGLLLGSSTLVMQDVWKRFFPKTVTEKNEVFLSRLTVLGFSAVTYFLALTSVGILRTITTALAITASFTLLIVANIFWPKYCKKEAGFWTILASVLVWLAWTLFPQVRVVPHVVYLEWPVCLAVFALAYRFGTEPADSIIRR